MVHYAVRKGRTFGIYSSWEACEAQVRGYAGAEFKKFSSEAEATAYLADAQPPAGADAQPPAGSDKGGRGLQLTPAKLRHVRDQRETFFSEGLSPEILKQIEDNRAKALAIRRAKAEAAANQTSPIKRPATDLGDVTSTKQKKQKEDTPTALPAARPLGPAPTPGPQLTMEGGYAVVFTDGSCLGNGRVGAKAGYGIYWGRQHPWNASCRLEGLQTNQRAELTAAIRALETAKGNGIGRVALRTDSQYTIKAVTEWIPKWKRRGWKDSTGNTPKNIDLHRTLDQLATAAGLAVKFAWCA